MNTVDGCACPKGADCKSPGKHPYKSSHGVHDATTDLDIISAWRGEYNIAVALGHRGLLALDIDNSEVARALIESARIAGGETGVVRTRRGVHIYFISSGEASPTRDLFDIKTGECIGQIRGTDSYVVAPPSLTAGGRRRYKWVGEKYEDWTPRLKATDDPSDYAVRLLRDAGYSVEVASSVALRDIRVDGDIREITRLPRAMRSLASLRDVRFVLSGHAKQSDVEGDRSRDIQRCAALLAYGAASVGYVIKPLRLAGIIKALDVRYFDKYTSRPGPAADREYMRSAEKVLTLPSAQIREDSGVSEKDDSPYVWDEETGQLCFVVHRARGPAHLKPIANFLPTIFVTSTIDDPDKEEKETRWRIRASKNGREEEIGVAASDYERSRNLSAMLTRKLPYDFVVAHGGEEHMLPAIKEVAPPDVPVRRVPAVPGWYAHKGGSVYVMPGSEVAIGSAGVEQSFQLHREDLSPDDAMMSPPLQNYGVGVRLPMDEADATRSWRALGRLFRAAPPHISAAIVLQVLAGPLYDAGVSDAPPLVHIVGRTGVLKTAYCLAALSLMGRFSDTGGGAVTWGGSTPFGIGQALNRARHMTLLIDDYKRSSVRKDVRQFIQQYADGTYVVRHSLSGQPHERPRGLILSNGEDRFRGEASVAARTTTVEVKDGDVSGVRLARSQMDAENGALARLGALWLRWLARSGALDDGSVRVKREEIHARLLSADDIVAGHRRTLRSASTLLAVGATLERFAADDCPLAGVRGTLRDGVGALERYFVDTSSERAEEVEALAPLDHLTGFLAEKVSASEAKFRQRLGRGLDYPDAPGARIIGWYDGETAYLSEHLTFAYYQEEMRRRNEEMAHGWSSIIQNIRERFGPGSRTQIWAAAVEDHIGGESKTKTSRFVYAVPMALIVPKSKKRSKNKGRHRP